MRYDDLDIVTMQLFLILGGLIAGILVGLRNRRRLPPPDPKTQRNKVSYL